VDAGKRGGLEAAIRALWERERPEMMRRVAAVEIALTRLAADQLDQAERIAAQDAAHKIAGAAGTFGFAAASREARAVELALRGGATAADGDQLAARAAAMRDDFGNEPRP
jgi:HPt (histidine-containing phosphotransfer) domain-containing protein